MLRYPRRIQLRLTGIFSSPLTMITAPDAFGAGEMVRTFLKKRRSVKTLCFPFRPGEAESAAWARFHAESGIPGLPNALPEGEEGTREVCRAVRAAVEGVTVLLLENCGAVEPGAFSELVKALLEAELRDLHVVTLSRRRPCFVSEELAYSEACLWLSLEDLSLTRAETGEIFAGSGLSLSEESWAQIRGWPSLAWTAARLGGTLPPEEKAAFDREILEAYPAAMQAMVRRLAFYGRMTRAEAVKLLGRKASWALTELTEDGLAERDGETYVFHPLLSGELPVPAEQAMPGQTASQRSGRTRPPIRRTNRLSTGRNPRL